MPYRDPPPDRIEAELRPAVDWLNVYVFATVVVALASVVLVTSWLVSAS